MSYNILKSSIFHKFFTSQAITAIKTYNQREIKEFKFEEKLKITHQ